MYFLYDLAQFRRNQPVHLLQEQLWHSLSSPPPKNANKNRPSNTFFTSEKVPKHQENLRSLWRKSHWSEDSTKSPTPSLTSSRRTKSPISASAWIFRKKKIVSWWVNFQQAGGVHLEMQNQQTQVLNHKNTCFKAMSTLTMLQVHVCPSRSPYQHLFGTNIYLTISYHLFYLNLIFSAPERRWHCQKSVESLVHSPGNPEEMQSPPRSSEMHDAPPFHWLSELEILDKLRGTFLKHLEWDDGTYGT